MVYLRITAVGNKIRFSASKDGLKVHFGEQPSHGKGLEWANQTVIKWACDRYGVGLNDIRISRS